MQCMGFAATPACAARWFKERGKKFPKQMGPVAIILTGHKMKDGKMGNGAGQVPFTYLKPISKFFMTTPNDFMYPENEDAVNSTYFHLRFALERRDLSYLGSMVVTLLTTNGQAPFVTVFMYLGEAKNEQEKADLALIIEGKTMKEVAYFVAQKLATIEYVTATATHFVLRKYKDKGVVFGHEPEKDEREGII